jgi:hypothetical protein
MKSSAAIAQVPAEKSVGNTGMKIHEERLISGDIETLWRIVTDVNRWPTWDPHEEAAELHGPFAQAEPRNPEVDPPRGGCSPKWKRKRRGRSKMRC